MASDLLTFIECADEIRKTVRPEEVTGARYIGLEHIEQDTLHLSSFGSAEDVTSAKAMFSKGDILFGKLRPYFRKVVRAPFDGVCSTDIWVVQAKDGIEQGFLYYWMASQEFVNFSMQGSEGTKMPRAKWEHVGRHQIPFFNESEQRTIAHILGSLDDKIELNRRMNETLEAMAQVLFKSWFVDFDPVIDNAILVGNPIPDEFAQRAEQRRAILAQNQPSPPGRGGGEGLPNSIRQLFPNEFEFTEELGWIPKGWSVGPISELANLNPELWSSKNAPQQIKYVDLANTKNGRINLTVPYEFSEAPSRARRVLKPDDTIIGTVRPGNRSFSYVHEDGLTGSTGFAIMRPKKDFCKIFLYLTLTQDVVIDHFSHLADGAAYPAIRPNVVADLRCVLPSTDVLRQFDSYTYASISKIGKNISQAGSLLKIRETLLPKLLSGELCIPEAEKLVEGAV